METERLNFLVQPGKEEDFLSADEQIYGPWLRKQPGYIQKQVIRYPAGRITLLIYWRSQEDWDRAASQPGKERLDALLRAKFRSSYTLLPSR